jgi:hypothetical protein
MEMKSQMFPTKANFLRAFDQFVNRRSGLASGFDDWRQSHATIPK